MIHPILPITLQQQYNIGDIVLLPWPWNVSGVQRRAYQKYLVKEHLAPRPFNSYSQNFKHTLKKTNPFHGFCPFDF